jgi:hypothetical protein
MTIWTDGTTTVARLGHVQRHNVFHLGLRWMWYEIAMGARLAPPRKHG